MTYSAIRAGNVPPPKLVSTDAEDLLIPIHEVRGQAPIWHRIPSTARTYMRKLPITVNMHYFGVAVESFQKEGHWADTWHVRGNKYCEV
jgi:hypothetical protein